MEEYTEKITGTISSVELKNQGIAASSSKPWKLFSVVIDGKKFSTFDTAYTKLIGVQGTFPYKEDDVVNRDGKSFVSKNLAPARFANTSVAQQQERHEVATKDDVRIEKILQLVESIHSHIYNSVTSVGNANGIPSGMMGTTSVSDDLENF